MPTGTVLNLYGPTFLPSDAAGIGPSTPMQSIQQVRVYFLPAGVTDPKTYPPLKTTLDRLKPYLAPDCAIVIADETAGEAQTVYAQLLAEARQQQAQRWKILQDTQQKIFEIQQDVTANKAKTQDKMYKKWDEYIRG
jgi:hypothetical protein